MTEQSLIQKHGLEKHLYNHTSQDVAKRRLDKTKEALNTVKQEKHELLPFEKPLGKDLESFLKGQESELRIESEIVGIRGLNLSFLEQTRSYLVTIGRDNKKINVNLPIFAIYKNSNLFGIRIYRSDDTCWEPSNKPSYKRELINRFPELIRKSYRLNRKDESFCKDLKDVLRLKFREHLNIYSKFFGFMPREVRQEVLSAKKHFGEEIYLIAEANFSSAKFERRRIEDPLIVGIDKKYQKAYLLACFDCTPLEKYAAENFSLNGGN